jgi:hypothetical protein
VCLSNSALNEEHTRQIMSSADTVFSLKIFASISTGISDRTPGTIHKLYYRVKCVVILGGSYSSLELHNKTSHSPEFALHQLNSSRTTDRSEMVENEENTVSEKKRAEAHDGGLDEWQSSTHNPRNWSRGKKWMITSIISFTGFLNPLASR